MDGSTDESGTAGRACCGLSRSQLQPAPFDEDDHEVHCIPAVGKLRRGMEGFLYELLRAKIRPRNDWAGNTRHDCSSYRSSVCAGSWGKSSPTREAADRPG